MAAQFVLGVTVALAAAAAPFAVPPAFRRLRAGLTRQAAGPAAVSPSRPLRGGETGRPEPQPRGEATGPFGYDNGVTIGEGP